MGSKRVAIVTGSNKGIGFAIVEGLCKQFDGVVYLTSRDEERGRKAVAELNERGYQPKFHQLDIDDEKSVERLCSYLLQEYGGLDVLVNNAGIAFRMDSTEPLATTVERTIRTNFFHTLRTCRILFSILRDHARVVNLTSDDGHLLKIDGQEPQAAQLRATFADPDITTENLAQLMRNYIDAVKEGNQYELGWPQSEGKREDTWPNDGYIVSKVGISAMTRIQQRQFLQDERKGLIINAVHPGYVNTDMTSFKGELTIEQGAAAAVWLAVADSSEVPRGSFVWHTKQVIDWVHGPVPEGF